MFFLIADAFLFLSTPSARRATVRVSVLCIVNTISIHALREEGDQTRRSGAGCTTISIHALREEGDRTRVKRGHCIERFLSTPSARRATGRAAKIFAFSFLFLSTPSARRATRGVGSRFSTSIFLSTPSARRATRGRVQRSYQQGNFYPRPPRGGRRAAGTKALQNTKNFYPRPPRGGRRGA